jgi:hypothetical protein
MWHLRTAVHRSVKTRLLTVFGRKPPTELSVRKSCEVFHEIDVIRERNCGGRRLVSKAQAREFPHDLSLSPCNRPGEMPAK